MIPGGASVQRLIGLQPLVVEHHGQFGNSSGSSGADYGDDTLHDMSVACGDVSVQVVHNCKR